MKEVKQRSLKKWAMIAFWVFMIVISFQARNLLSGGITSSTDLVDTSTQSGAGNSLYKARFNVSSDSATQIIVLKLDNSSDSILSVQWRTFTYYLTLLLNDTYSPRNYTTVVSEPLLLSYGLTDRAESLVSKDNSTGLIYMSGLRDSLSYKDDVKTIRDLLGSDNLLQNVTDFRTQYISDHPMASFNVTAMPSSSDMNQIQLILTGPLANFVDIIAVAQETFDSSEIIAVLVVLVILAFVFRSPLGLIIPFISMAAALLPTYLATYILSLFGIVSINEFLPAIIAMIGIAVAIDYNLFNLVRYKEEFHKRKAQGLLDGAWDKDDIRHAELESSAAMNKSAGTAVMYSGITVIIGFLSLLVLDSGFSNGMALAVSVVVIFSILTARTLTPAILGLWGRYLDWPNFSTRASKAIENQQNKVEIKNIWTKWSDLVMKHALSFLIIGILIILPVTFLSLQTNLGFDTVKNLPPGTESRDGFEIIQNKFDLGSTNPYYILIDTKKADGVFNSNIINATNKLANWAMNFEDTHNGVPLNFSSVNSLSVKYNPASKNITTYSSEYINQTLSAPDYYILGPNNIQINYQKVFFVQEQLDPFVNVNNKTEVNNTLIISISTNLDPGSSEAWFLVSQIRDEVNTLFSPLGVDTYVYGYAASFYDTQQTMYQHTPAMLIVAVILIFIALMILFRSLLLPAKAIITISGSILFALGSLVYIFQQGNFLWIVNGEQIDGITFFIPVFLFTIVLGLGMDYSIFIISRIREEYEKGASAHDAVGIGLSKTANVVTSAATVMIATFLVFALAPILFLKTIGLAMSVAILVDATVSRMILLPSAMALAGRWNWYLPGWLKKILPEIKLEH